MTTPPAGDAPPAPVPFGMEPTPALPSGVRLRPLGIADHAAAFALWQASPGVGIVSEDEPSALARFLVRNPGLSQAACRGESLIGTVLCGHDGRRGALFHLAVAQAERAQGIGTALIADALRGLRAQGIRKCNLLVYAENAAARRLYERGGWRARDELRLLQRTIAPADA